MQTPAAHTQAVTNHPAPVAVHGAAGRMGRRLTALALQDSRLRLCAALVRPDDPLIGQPSLPGDDRAPRYAALSTPELRGAAVLIDFSSPQGAAHAAAVALQARLPLLVGTTGLSLEQRAAVERAAAAAPVIIAPNTSLGVAVTAHAAALVARLLGQDFRASIVEAHHSHKKDAPSGTALRMARAARDAGASLPDDQILSIRAGDIVGEHTLRFAGPGEEITITHRATSRDLFARGALRAALWLAQPGTPPGLYTIEHALGLSSSA
ncbi:MAG: 4-hydroxy-tetrahydrodipicolinate reductase [Planctomyces sp.]|nr:4-hydroxy-tetrahydrodipicolinate reductase [Planctomyces sp.]MBA4039403.1 4-hydroxy-tetrahydrodipicolinate reductase [Planctomyces sp.]